ncbi:MAG: type II toxin-antitoxin system RelE/ParE family toxin [Alphaproteobacteria bacterium]|nr:type II toxin-antitoxin system RelE/ParE family toxin [Alphaproteobacteria bacterium]
MAVVIVSDEARGDGRENLGPDIRIMVAWPYVVFYRYQTDNNTVYVLRIVHGSQNIKSHDVT